jgi:hypothetical protein
VNLITSLNSCRVGILHDYRVKKEGNRILDFPRRKWEQCILCGEEIEWTKVNGRTDNTKYLEAHLRDFLQREGPTAKLYYAIYKPDEYEQNREKWTIHI